MSETLPIRANNPFALIQKKPQAWQGLVSVNERGFLFFDTPLNGTRAGFISFINTYLKRGINTIEKIFPIYAPKDELTNDPALYIQNVSKLTKIPSGKPLTTAEEILSVGKAIIRVESGKDWIDNATLVAGYMVAAQQTGFPQLKKKSVRLAIPFFFLILSVTLWTILRKKP
jgi:hypothetical protein